MPSSHTCLANYSRACGSILLLGVLAWPTGVSAESPTTSSPLVESQDADVLFTDAATQFKQGAYAKALALFTRVAQLKDSPNVELYVGYCHSELGSDKDAHYAFSLVVRQALDNDDPKYTAALQAARDQLALLNLRLAKLTISLVDDNQASTVNLDQIRLGPNELGSPIVVNPGIHHIVAESAGRKTLKRDIELEKGSSKTITLLFEPARALTLKVSQPPPPDPQGMQQSHGTPWTTFGYSAAGLALVGYGVFAVAGYQTKNNYDRLKRECTTGCSDPTHRELIDNGKTYQTLANVGLATGIVGTIAGATMLYLGYSNDEHPKPTLAVGAGTFSLACEGKF